MPFNLKSHILLNHTHTMFSPVHIYAAPKSINSFTEVKHICLFFCISKLQHHTALWYLKSYSDNSDGCSVRTDHMFMDSCEMLNKHVHKYWCESLILPGRTGGLKWTGCLFLKILFDIKMSNDLELKKLNKDEEDVLCICWVPYCLW